MASFYDSASIITIPSGYKAGTLYSAKPTDGTGDISFTRTGSTATRVNSAVIIERCITNLILNSATLSTQSVTLTAQIHTLSFFGTGSVTLGGTGSGTLTGTGASNRVSLTFTPTAGSVSFTVTGSVTSAQLQTGDIATNYIATAGTAVTEGPVTNLPRLDYLTTTCPQLLMEPTRTNLLIYSQQINNTGGWSFISSTTITANSTTSPDGYTNADLVTGGASSALTRVVQTYAATSGTTYSFSAFVKEGPTNAKTALSTLTAPNVLIAGINIVFTSGVIAITATGTTTNAKAENYGNGWYRVSGTYVAPSTETSKYAYFSDTDGTNKNSYLWGAQLEVGTHVTSYIPTTNSTATRNNDAAVKTSISALIGQTEGTLYWEGIVPPTDTEILVLEKSSPLCIARFRKVGTSTIAQLFINSSGFNFNPGTTLTVGSRVKLALGYKSGSLVYYANGNLITQSSSTFSSLSLDTLRLANDFGTPVVSENENSQFFIFKTRLTNAELATLTTL
jgi:hypothetical protein